MTTNHLELRGKNVLVTGASRGLDLALARAAAAGLHGHELGDACLIRSGSGAPAPR